MKFNYLCFFPPQVRLIIQHCLPRSSAQLLLFPRGSSSPAIFLFPLPSYPRLLWRCRSSGPHPSYQLFPHSLFFPDALHPLRHYPLPAADLLHLPHSASVQFFLTTATPVLLLLLPFSQQLSCHRRDDHPPNTCGQHFSRRCCNMSAGPSKPDASALSAQPAGSAPAG